MGKYRKKEISGLSCVTRNPKIEAPPKQPPKQTPEEETLGKELGLTSKPIGFGSGFKANLVKLCSICGR